MQFSESGEYVEEDALGPVVIDREKDWEPYDIHIIFTIILLNSIGCIISIDLYHYSNHCSDRLSPV